MEVDSQPDAPAAVPQGFSLRYPLDRRLGGLQRRVSQQNGEQNHTRLTVNKYFENVAKFKYLVATEI
jgi:hypothetical protein